MKKARVISSVIAGLLAIGTVSASLALYTITNAADGKVYTIGGSITGDGEYTLTEEVNKVYNSDGQTEITDKTLVPGAIIDIQYKLGFTASTDSTYKHSTIFGNLAFELTGDAAKYLEFAATEDSKPVTYIDYSKEGDHVANPSGYSKWGSNTNATMQVAHESLSFNYDVPFSIDGTECVVIKLKVKDSVTDSTFIDTLAEKSYSWSLKLTQPKDVSYAYVVGSMTKWEMLDSYQMAPNLGDFNNAGWMYQGLSLTADDQLKARTSDTWSANSGTSSGNVEISETKTYNVWWDGTSGAATTIS